MTELKLDSNNIELLFITDLHLSDRPPGKRTDGYRRQLLNKLRFVGQEAHKRNAVVLCGGDVFHVKNPNSPANSLSIIVEIMEILKTFPHGKMFGCYGNHDVSFDRKDTLKNQPLGVLVEAGVYELLNDNPLTIESKEASAYIQTWDYMEGEPLLASILASKPLENPVDYRIGIVHGTGVPGNSREQFGSFFIGYEQLKDIDFDLLLWGHDHTRTETQTCGSVRHINLGSMSRAALSEDEVDRKVVIAGMTLSKESGKTYEIEIPVVETSKVFRTEDAKMEKVEVSKEVQKFFKKMESSLDEVESDDPRKVIETLCGEDKELADLSKELCNL